MPQSLKLHEDWGTTPAVIDASLNTAEAADIQVRGDLRCLTASLIAFELEEKAIVCLFL